MKTILIIEDDQAELMLLENKLSSPDVHILTAPDAKAGWNIIVKEDLDLIITDIMLPGGMNGFELLDQLKRNSKVKDIPVLVLTNLDTEEEAMRKMGVADYLVKASTSMDDIAAKVNSLLGM